MSSWTEQTEKDDYFHSEMGTPGYVNGHGEPDDRQARGIEFAEETLASADKMSLLEDLLSGLSEIDRQIVEEAASLFQSRGQDRFTQTLHSIFYLGEIKDGSIKTKVRGVAITPQRQEALRRLSKVDQALISLSLEPEPDNEADPFALKVMVAFNGSQKFHLGYINYNRSPFIEACSRFGIQFDIYLLQITGGGKGKHWGMNIELVPVQSEPEVDLPF